MRKMFIFVLFFIIMILASCKYASRVPAFNESNKCLALTNNLARNFNKCDVFNGCGEFQGEVGKDLEMGGILVDYEKYQPYYNSSPLPFYYDSQGNIETDKSGFILSIGGKRMYMLSIRVFNTTAYIILVTPDLNYSRGKFYKFNSKDIRGLDDYNTPFVDELTEVNECDNNTEYTKYVTSQPGYVKDYFCEQNSDCIIRTNNYRKVIAYHRDDPAGIKWEKTIETGSPGHTAYPNPKDVIAKCDNGKCVVGFDCSTCDLLKQRFSYCEGEPVADVSCWAYKDCNC